MEKLEKLLKDENFIHQISSIKDLEKLKKFLNEYDIEITEDELKNLENMISESKNSSSKLSDEEIKKVVGGVSTDTLKNIAGISLMVLIGSGCIGLAYLADRSHKNMLANMTPEEKARYYKEQAKKQEIERKMREKKELIDYAARRGVSVSVNLDA